MQRLSQGPSETVKAGLGKPRLHRKWAILAIVTVATLLAVGCARYRIGSRSLYPPDICTVYVPVFESTSFRRNLGERLTEAVCKCIEDNTPYKLVNGPEADSILNGKITSETKRILVESPTDEPRQLDLNFAVTVTWVDRRGDLIQQMSAVPMPPELVDLGRDASVVPEVGQSITTGQQQAIERLARQIVGLMENPW